MILSLLPVLICISVELFPKWEVTKDIKGVYINKELEIKRKKLAQEHERRMKEDPEYRKQAKKDEEKMNKLPGFKETAGDVVIGKKVIKVKRLDIYSVLSYRFLLCFIVLLSLACLGSKAISDEVEMGTLQLLFMRPVTKIQIYFAKLCVLVIGGLILAIPPLILMNIILFKAEMSIVTLSSSFIIAFLGIFAYSSIFLLCGMFNGGIYISIGYAFFWEIMIALVTERAKTFAISYYLNSLSRTMLYPVEEWAKWTAWKSITPIFSAISILIIIPLSIFIIGVIIFRKKEFNFC